MDEKNDLIKVGKYDLRYNELLSIDIEELDIFRSKGLPAHMVKRKHFNCLKYIDYLPEIIENLVLCQDLVQVKMRFSSS